MQHIEIDSFLRSAYFRWTGDDSQFFYRLIHLIYKDLPYNRKFPELTTISQISFWGTLCSNKRFVWTPELLKVAFDFHENLENFHVGKPHMLPIYIRAFKLYPELSKNIDVPLCLCKIKEGRNTHYAYSIYFKTENIIQNWDKWNKIISNKFVRQHRLSRDTWFSVYQAKTMWNYFNENEHIVLTYDICKILNTKPIIIGGEYEKEYENQDFLDAGFITKEINALEYFAAHPISSEEDLKKIYENSELFQKLILNKNQSLIDYTLKLFFSNYSPIDFFNSLEAFKSNQHH